MNSNELFSSLLSTATLNAAKTSAASNWGKLNVSYEINDFGAFVSNVFDVADVISDRLPTSGLKLFQLASAMSALSKLQLPEMQAEAAAEEARKAAQSEYDAQLEKLTKDLEQARAADEARKAATDRYKAAWEKMTADLAQARADAAEARKAGSEAERKLAEIREYAQQGYTYDPILDVYNKTLSDEEIEADPELKSKIAEAEKYSTEDEAEDEADDDVETVNSKYAFNAATGEITKINPTEEVDD